MDFIFFGIIQTYVLFQKRIKPDINISIVILLQKVCDQPVCDLSVEDEVANQVVLANECRGVLAEVVEDLHDLI